MTEEWRPITNFPEYAVSSLGNVKRVVPDCRNHKPRVLKPWLNNKGYAVICLASPEGVVKKLVSRLVCEAFHGPPPSGAHHAAHGDGDPTRNHADNLRWATRVENMADCIAHGTKAVGERHGRSTKPGRTPRGEKHGHAKLDERDVLAIRASTETGRLVAAQYGVSPATICVIRSRKTWTHLS